MIGDQRPLDSSRNLTERLDIDFALQAAGLGVWEIDPTTNQVYWDERCRALVGLDRNEDMPFEQAIQYIHPDDLTQVLDAIQWAMKPESGGAFDQTYRTLGADGGQLRWVRFWGQGYFTPTGEVYRFAGVAQEVTQLVVSQQKLEESKAQLHSVVQQTPAPTLVLRGEEYRIDQINQPMLAFMGRGEEVIGQPFLAVMPELAHQFAWQQVQRVYQEGVTLDLPEVLVPHVRNGVLQNIYYNVAYRPLREGGQITGMIQVAVDVTGQVMARQTITESEARFRSIVQQSPAATLVLRGNDFIIEQINQPMLSFMGRGEEVVGQPLLSVIPELAGQHALQQARKVYHEGTPFDGHEVLIPHERTGTRQDYYYDLSYRPLREDGQITGMIHVVTDVTPQVRARQQVEQSEQQLRQLIEHSPVAVGLLMGRELVVEQVNDSILAIWGKDRSVIGKPLAEALPELVGQPFLPLLDEVYTTGRAYHTDNDRVELKVNGVLRTYYLAFSYTPLRNATHDIYAILVTATDVTEQVKSRQQVEAARQDLLQVNQRLSLAMNAGRLGAYTLDLATGRMDVSPQCRANYGQPAGTPFNFPDLMATIVADDRERVQQAVTTAVETRTIYTAEYRIVWPDETLHWVKASGQPEYGADGQPLRIVGVTQEITAQRIMQQELERQVQQRTQQLQASVADLRRSNDNLQQFAYIASHDLQEPLRKIQSFGDLLKTQYAESLGEGVSYLERMQTAASRMSTLIKDLLTYSRISTRQETTAPVPLTGVMQTVLVDLELPIAEAGAQVIIAPLPTVPGDASQLSQLFGNLLSNALKFRRPGVPPMIRVGCQRVAVGELPAWVRPTRAAAAYYQIEVIDNGIGFDSKYVDRIFQVFQRLHGKNEYAGTGIGLAICDKVVANHGGAITARSQPGQGATFSVYLPV